MADPLSLAAVIALAFAGKHLSDNNLKYQQEPIAPHANRQNVTEMLNAKANTNRGPVYESNLDGTGVKMEHPSFGVISEQIHAQAGEPLKDFRDRQYISGLMNNLSPATKELVGPGLGVSAEVPAYGGYQQMYRVNPVNVGEYKLTQLPGMINHGSALNKQPGYVGELTHHKPETTAYLPQRLPPTRGRASGQGGNLSGVRPREEYERTKRITARSTTGYRGDGLGFAPASSTVSALQLDQAPSRNKGDRYDQVFAHVDNAAPGISGWSHGYTQTPTDLRVADKRGQGNRQGNAGRMNVRETAQKTAGRATAVRFDQSRTDGRIGAAEPGGRFQQYAPLGKQNNNVFKGNLDDRVVGNGGLQIAHSVMKNNPLVHHVGAA
jgi:hypothetical protein